MISSTYRTKLKLDKEVGGGDFSELCTVTYLITYLYGWTVNFEIWNLRFKHRGTKNGMLLTTHQPPIAKASQTWARSYKYIGDWVGKTEGSLLDSYQFFEDWKAENSLSKSGRFRTSGSTFWSRSTRGRFDSDLTVSRTTCELAFCIRVRERSRFCKY